MINSSAFAVRVMQPVITELVPWNSCKLAAALILTLAAPKDTEATFEAMEFSTASMGGLLTMKMINSTPSASLPAAFAKAKKVALDGEVGTVTILGVNLVDVEMIERGERRSKDMKYSSFAHTFVLGISRAGWRVYQAWGEHGYRLDQWIAKGGAQIRDWDAARDFLRAFIRLAIAEVSVHAPAMPKYSSDIAFLTGFMIKANQ